MTIDSLHIGVIAGGAPTGVGVGLAEAAARHPGLTVRALRADEPYAPDVAGVIVAAALAERAQILAHVAPRWPVPILIESPVATDVDQAHLVEHLGPEAAIVVANPLRYALHTRRFLDEVARADDPLETFFAAWRWRAPASAAHALPQLLDYLRALCPDEPVRISAMQRGGAMSVLTLTLRYASDVLGSIEVGNHLPASFPSESELLVECFCQASAYACLPGNQAVQLYGGTHAAYEWQPDPADAIVTAFVDWLRGAARPPGDITRDLTILRFVDRINQALQLGGVLDVDLV